MNAQEVFNLIEKIETDLDLKNFKVMGIDVWPHLRTQLIMTFYQKMEGNNISSQNYLGRVLKKAKILPSAFVDFIKYSYKLNYNKRDLSSNKDIVFLTDSSAKRMMIYGKWYDIFIDPIIDYYSSMGYSHFTFETSQQFIFRSPGYRKSNTLSITMIKYYLISIILQYRIKFDDTFLNAYEKYRIVLLELGLGEYVISLSNIKMEVSYVFHLSIFFSNKIKKLSPKIVFLVPYSGYSGKALCYACRNLLIKTIDIQHGVQGQFHPTYASFNNIPENSFNVLPNIFLTWSEYESKIITSWARNTNNTIAIPFGNLFQEMFLNNSNFSIFFDHEFSRLYKDYLKKKLVLITLSWGTILPSIYRNLLQLNSEKYFYLIRFHPSTPSKERSLICKELQKLSANNYEYLNASNLPIHTILRNINFHITDSSSVVIEAVIFNVKSIITGIIGKGYYQDLIDNGQAFYCTNEEMILDIMETKASYRFGDTCPSNPEVFNSSANIILRELIDSPY